MILCRRNNKFLYEARPDLFPHGRLGAVEIDLWERFQDFEDEVRKANG